MIGFFDGLQPDRDGRPFGIYSVVTGIVKENWDEEHQGMVKVEYSLGEPGLNVSGWMPVISFYAGAEFGIYMLPEVGAEVVVAFRQGDRNCPVVIGSLWSQTNALPAETAKEDNSVKLIRTKAGCMIRFSEEEGKEKIEIQTPGGLKAVLDDEKQTMELADKEGKNQLLLNSESGELTLSADKKLTLKAGGKEIFATDGSQASLKAGTVNVEAQQGLNLKGQTGKVEGTSVEVKANGSLKLEASGITEVKGNMLKLN